MHLSLLLSEDITAVKGNVLEERRVEDRTVQNMLTTVGKLAELNKNVHPHVLRHGRLTFFVKQGFKESGLRILAGWEKESNMPATYVHLAGADVDKKLLIKNGLMLVSTHLLG